MSLAHEVDSIVAIATPPGEGGISVIRLSGEKAIALADRGFIGQTALKDAHPSTAHYGRFVDDSGKTLDHLIALVFRNPHSYTGEDTVEFSCHGGHYVAKQILESLVRFGARPADPGEFTKRAFLNGKMDLVQAEAVADLIHSRSERAHQASLAQLEGLLSDRIEAVRNRLIESIGKLELELDFAEDGYEFADRKGVADLLRGSLEEMSHLLSTYSVGRIYRDGVRVVLAGSPNVGKSSLLNALLRQDRAIVTDIPGTTRDVIEESISFGGLLFSLSDTAGLRETEDPIEKEGIRRAEKTLLSSDVVVLIIDGSKPLNQSEAHLLKKTALTVKAEGVKCVLAVNKIDLKPLDREWLIELGQLATDNPVVGVSAKTQEGIEDLEKALWAAAVRQVGLVLETGVVVTNMRHAASLERARNSLNLALKTLEDGRSSEFVAIDLRSGLDALGEITGAVTTDDILNSVFSKFCIGK